MKHRSALICSAVLAFGSLVAAQTGGPTCCSGAPKDLGTLGGTISSANGIERQGLEVAGAANTTDDDASHAVIWSAKGSPTDLGVLSGGTNSSAAAVNYGHVAAGTSDYDDGSNGVVPFAFIYENGKMSSLGTLGGAASQAYGINDNRVVVGYSYNLSGAYHAFATNPSNSNQLIDLGTLGGTNSYAYAVSHLGFVAGASQTTSTDQYGNQITDAVIWNLNNNKPYDIGGLGGSYAQLDAINNDGQGTGYAQLPFKGSIVTIKDNAIVYRDSKVWNIGTLGGAFAQGTGINKNGTVVGFSTISDNQTNHAFIWTAKGGMVDLNTLLPSGSPWTLSVANGIDDNGRIVGYGLINGEYHAFIW